MVGCSRRRRARHPTGRRHGRELQRCRLGRRPHHPHADRRTPRTPGRERAASDQEGCISKPERPQHARAQREEGSPSDRGCAGEGTRRRGVEQSRANGRPADRPRRAQGSRGSAAEGRRTRPDRGRVSNPGCEDAADSSGVVGGRVDLEPGGRQRPADRLDPEREPGRTRFSSRCCEPLVHSQRCVIVDRSQSCRSVPCPTQGRRAHRSCRLHQPHRRRPRYGLPVRRQPPGCPPHPRRSRPEWSTTARPSARGVSNRHLVRIPNFHFRLNRRARRIRQRRRIGHRGSRGPHLDLWVHRFCRLEERLGRDSIRMTH